MRHVSMFYSLLESGLVSQDSVPRDYIRGGVGECMGRGVIEVVVRVRR